MNKRYAVPIKIVLELLYRDLVARDDGGGEHNRIALRERDVLVLLGCDTHERGELFALSASGENHDFIRRVIAEVLSRDNRGLVHFEEARLLSDLNVGTDRAAFGDDLFAVFLCRPDDA